MAEINRILKIGGTCRVRTILIVKTMKRLLFIAERNAKSKNFPNRFTDVKKLIEHLPVLGSSCEKLNIFIRRGDFGDNKKTRVAENWIPEFCKYCIILKRARNASRIDVRFASEFSKTAKDMTRE